MKPFGHYSLRAFCTKRILDFIATDLGTEIASARMSMKHVLFIACLIAAIHSKIDTLFAQEPNLIQAARREGRVVGTPSPENRCKSLRSLKKNIRS